MKLETLQALKQNFVEQMTKEHDRRNVGAAKAAVRAEERQRLATENLKLVDEAASAKLLLHETHFQRAWGTTTACQS